LHLSALGQGRRIEVATRSRQDSKRFSLLMQKRLREPAIERRLRSRGVLLSHNQIALLRALATFPDNTAPSARDWVRAAMPFRIALVGFARCGVSALYKGTQKIHTSWVSRERRGRKVAARLLARGANILSGELPARISGRGFYDPIATFAKVSPDDIKAELVDLTIIGARHMANGITQPSAFSDALRANLPDDFYRRVRILRVVYTSSKMMLDMSEDELASDRLQELIYDRFYKRYFHGAPFHGKAISQ
jgi:hypothetical protein